MGRRMSTPATGVGAMGRRMSTTATSLRNGLPSSLDRDKGNGSSNTNTNSHSSSHTGNTDNVTNKGKKRRSTKVLNLEMTTEIATANLKIEQERRRMRQKERIKLRLQKRHALDDALVSSSDSESHTSNGNVGNKNELSNVPDDIIDISDSDEENPNPDNDHDPPIDIAIRKVGKTKRGGRRKSRKQKSKSLLQSKFSSRNIKSQKKDKNHISSNDVNTGSNVQYDPESINGLLNSNNKNKGKPDTIVENIDNIYNDAENNIDSFMNDHQVATDRIHSSVMNNESNSNIDVNYNQGNGIISSLPTFNRPLNQNKSSKNLKKKKSGKKLIKNKSKNIKT